MAAASSAPAYTCTGGVFPTGMVHIPSGTYASITVAGACDVEPGAKISIVGNLNVLAGAVFDAQSAPSTITVGRNVTAAAGSLMGLGCQPDPRPPGSQDIRALDPYADGHSTITVNGNVTATGANTVLLNGITVKGNVTLTGGGGDIPWSVKNNTIERNLTVSEVTADWFGALFNNDRRQRDPHQHHRDGPGGRRPGRHPHRVHRAQHDRAQPHLHGNRPRLVLRLLPRPGQHGRP